MQAPSPPPIVYQQAPPPPAVTDPNVKEAARRERVLDDGLAGRGATLLAGGAQPDPSRRPGARLLGNFGTLGS